MMLDVTGRSDYLDLIRTVSNLFVEISIELKIIFAKDDAVLSNRVHK